MVHAAPPPLVGDYLRVVCVDSIDARLGPVLAIGNQGLVETTATRIPGITGHISQGQHTTMFGNSRTTMVNSRYRIYPQSYPLTRQFIAFLRSFFESLNSGVDRSMKPWLRGVIAGEGGGFKKSIKLAFIKTGLYHLLVISGLHITIIAKLTTGFLCIPARLLYAVRLLRLEQFLRVSSLISIVACIVGSVYCAFCGLSAATQRAMIIYLFNQLLPIFLGVPCFQLRISLALAVQLIFYPIGFLSEATLMSWCAYILVIHAQSSGFISTILLQFKLLVLNTAVFSQVSWLSLVANPIMVPIFPILLVSGFVYLAVPESIFGQLGLSIQLVFIEITEAIAGLTGKFPWLFVSAEEVSQTFRGSSLILTGVLMLNALRDLSIREGDRPSER